MKISYSILISLVASSLLTTLANAQSQIFNPPIVADDPSLIFSVGGSTNNPEISFDQDSPQVRELLPNFDCFSINNTETINCQYNLNYTLTMQPTTYSDANRLDDNNLANYVVTLTDKTQFRVRTRPTNSNAWAIFEFVNNF